MNEVKLKQVQDFSNSDHYSTVREFCFTQNSQDGDALKAFFNTFEAMKDAGIKPIDTEEGKGY